MRDYEYKAEDAGVQAREKEELQTDIDRKYVREVMFFIIFFLLNSFVSGELTCNKR